MNKRSMFLMVVAATVLGLAGPASATSTVDNVNTLTASAVSEISPVLIALATGILGLVVLRWGVRKVLSIAGGRRSV